MGVISVQMQCLTLPINETIIVLPGCNKNQTLAPMPTYGPDLHVKAAQKGSGRSSTEHGDLLEDRRGSPNSYFPQMCKIE